MSPVEASVPKEPEQAKSPEPTKLEAPQQPVRRTSTLEEHFLRLRPGWTPADGHAEFQVIRNQNGMIENVVLAEDAPGIYMGVPDAERH